MKLSDIQIKSGRQFKTKCPLCLKNRKNKYDMSLSVNLDDMIYTCHHCGAKGVFEEKSTKSQLKSARIELAYKPSNKDICINWAKNRGITERALGVLKIESRNINGRDWIVFPFYKDGKVVNTKYKDPTTKAFMQDKNGEQCLYNFDNVKGQKVVLLTEGESDCLALLSSGFFEVCSTPSGADKNPSEKKLKWIEDAREIWDSANEIYICMDVDEVGIEYRKKVTKLIGEEKCKIVNYPNDCKDINDVLVNHGVRAVKRCISLAEFISVSGLEDWNKVDIEAEPPTYLTTGWASLDRHYTIHERMGSLNVLTGVPMSGKSEILQNVMVNTIRKHDWKWLVCSYEDDFRETFFPRIAEILIGKPYEKNWQKPHVKPMSLDDKEVARLFCQQYIQFLDIEREDCFSLETVLRLAKLAKYRHGIRGIILDPYNDIETNNLANENGSDKINRFLKKVRNFARTNVIDVWLVAHPTKLQKKDDGDYPVPSPYDIAGSANFRNRADNCFSIWRSMINPTNKIELHVQKVKNKKVGRCGMIELNWDSTSSRYEENE